jgi:DNA-binding NarL/FixJ family response regulator
MGATSLEKNLQNKNLQHMLCDDSAICDKYINDEVVILEDSEATCGAAKDVIEEELNWNIITVANKEDAILALEEKKVTFFIFDNCIGKKRNEGLDALEQVKARDNEVFVVIYSAYNSVETEKQATRLKANLFKEKTIDPHKDIREIISKFIKYKKKLFNSKIDEQLKRLKEQSNINIDAYEKAKLNKEWLKKYQNTYVTFVDGKFVDSDSSKQDLLKRLNDSTEYIDKQKFFIKVEEDLTKESFPIIEEPSSLWQDFIR